MILTPKRHFARHLWGIIAVLIAGFCGFAVYSAENLQAEQTVEPLVNTSDQSAEWESDSLLDVYKAQESLSAAFADMAHGRFAQAREKLTTMPELPGRLSMLSEGQQILDSYEQVTDALNEKYRETYDAYLKNLQSVVQDAQWRNTVLAASEKVTLESDEKVKFEKQTQEEIERDWIIALAQAAAAGSLAERTHLTESLDPQLKETIVGNSLQIANRLEEEGNWLAAYSRVYSYLTTLDKFNDEYNEQSKRLLRQATLVSLYVPDPNQDAVPWEDRRHDITFSMFKRSLRKLDSDYVNVPDYQAMTTEALNYCYYVGLTPELAQTFSGMQDEAALESFRLQIDDMRQQVQAKDKEQFHYTTLLEYLRDAMRLSDRTIHLPDNVVVAEFAEGAFSALDGYTYIVWPGDVEDFQKDMTNEFTGIGVVISKFNGLLTIDSLLDDSPALKAGLDAGDAIVKIDGRDTANITMNMAVKRITGPSGTTVKLTIDRKGFVEPRDFLVTRQQIVVRGLEGLYRRDDGSWEYFVDENEKIAYVRMKGFYRATADRLRDLMDDLAGQGMQGMILDLRRNSGGYFNVAVNIVSQFIEQGKVVVSTKPRSADSQYPEQVDRASGKWQFDTSLPMVILVDSLSASASEIVSGSLQDHGRATLVGTRTYGKGNMQTVEGLYNSDAEFKVTIAYYYLPKNRRVHRNPNDPKNTEYGVNPDVVVELTGEQFAKISELRRFGSILHQHGAATGEDDATYTVEQMLKDDPQLQVALLCAKSKLLSQQAQVLAQQHVVRTESGGIGSLQ